ncbi:SsgA family sporulation/cell division regulator, partial [Streptomyces nigra]
DGDALLEAPAAPVSAWLERTLRVVPPGTEGEQLGIDDALDELLAR